MFAALDQVFRFDWDVAATAASSKTGAARYFGPDQPVVEWRNALELDWGTIFLELLEYVRPTVWCNPPYARGMIDAFCQKAQDAADEGVTTVMLLPADISTRWFRRWIYRQEAFVYEGRGKFAGAPLDKDGKLAAAKFGSILRVFRPALPTLWWRL
jgi:hypothetical protein